MVLAFLLEEFLHKPTAPNSIWCCIRAGSGHGLTCLPGPILGGRFGGPDLASQRASGGPDLASQPLSQLGLRIGSIDWPKRAGGVYERRFSRSLSDLNPGTPQNVIRFGPRNGLPSPKPYTPQIRIHHLWTGL